MTEANIYAINTENQIEVGGKKANHVYVIAVSFEEALETCRGTYPDARVQGMRKMNSYNGLPVIPAPGTYESWKTD